MREVPKKQFNKLICGDELFWMSKLVKLDNKRELQVTNKLISFSDASAG